MYVCIYICMYVFIHSNTTRPGPLELLNLFKGNLCVLYKFEIYNWVMVADISSEYIKIIANMYSSNYVVTYILNRIDQPNKICLGLLADDASHKIRGFWSV